MIAILLTVYFVLGLLFIAALAFAASRRTPQVTNEMMPCLVQSETNFNSADIEYHNAA